MTAISKTLSRYSRIKQNRTGSRSHYSTGDRVTNAHTTPTWRRLFFTSGKRRHSRMQRKKNTASCDVTTEMSERKIEAGPFTWQSLPQRKSKTAGGTQWTRVLTVNLRGRWLKVLHDTQLSVCNFRLVLQYINAVQLFELYSTNSIRNAVV